MLHVTISKCSSAAKTGVCYNFIRKIIMVLLLFPSVTTSMAAELHLGDFASGDLSGWNDEVFKGNTDYELVKDAGRTS